MQVTARRIASKRPADVTGLLPGGDGQRILKQARQAANGERRPRDGAGAIQVFVQRRARRVCRFQKRQSKERRSLVASKRIGLIPNIDDSKILQVGNAAIEGACIALLSRSKRAELENLVRRVTHCRLEAHQNFFNFFVEGCQFNPVEISSIPEFS